MRRGLQRGTTQTVLGHHRLASRCCFALAVMRAVFAMVLGRHRLNPGKTMPRCGHGWQGQAADQQESQQTSHHARVIGGSGTQGKGR